MYEFKIIYYNLQYLLKLDMIWAKSKDAVQTNRNQHFCYETVQIQDLSL